jgi:hypothetical protein
MNMPATPRVLLAGVILELTLATAVVHLTLGGTLFTLNALGYLGLGAAYAAVALAPVPALRRVGWLPRVALATFTSVTIVAYLVSGAYFTLGWITEGVELAIVLLVVADLLSEVDAGRTVRRPPTRA